MVKKKNRDQCYTKHRSAKMEIFYFRVIQYCSHYPHDTMKP